MAARLGVRNIVLTNMSGGTQPEWTPPALAALSAHRDLQQGWIDGFRADAVEVYSPRFRRMLRESASAVGVSLHEGVYAGLLGPCYETPAEVRALHGLGCDMVGMSTVKEAVAARELGLECAAISCVSNLAAGVAAGPIDHADVVEAGRQAASSLAAVLEAFLERLHADFQTED
jgi:purine-nucleoside phosphorylase